MPNIWPCAREDTLSTCLVHAKLILKQTDQKRNTVWKWRCCSCAVRTCEPPLY